MIFPKEFRKCLTMSEECPNCGQLTNASFSRLIKDSCGHTKCRMCLLYEEHGCKICQAKHTQGTQDYLEKLCSTNGDSNDTHKLSSEEIVLPLELVINKDSKSKESQSLDSTSTECKSSHLHYENVTFDKDGVYKFAINDTITSNDSNKLYIPEIETRDVVLDTCSNLKKGDDHNSANLQTPCCNQAEEKLEKTVEKNKNIKCRDRSHITIIPGTPEKYKCNVCSKIFRNKKDKCYHDACVTGIKPYQCTFCDKSFVKRSHFEYHERVHKGHRPYKCNLCEKAFPQQNKLNRHMFSHSKEKQFVCPECNKRYSKRDDLKNHINVHNATAMYKCKSCDKSFRILTNLKRHMRTHTSERSHTCDECNKSFKDRFLLKRHKRTHERERPFSCAHCNKVFLSKSELRRHLTVHSDEKPFSCEYCQTPFRRKDNLNRHIRHHHTEDFSCETREMPIVEADSRSCSTKNNQQRSRQKQPRKTQPKSPGKITAAFPCSHVDQINSRLDSMGNITPIIKTTSEVSNAVPVINGPINIRRLEDRTDKKTFTYTVPIPIAEAVVINCRIEEKLYPQSASSHNYFVRSCLKDRNSRVNSYPNNKLTPQENHDSNMATSSRIESTLPRATGDRNDPTNVYEDKIARYDEEEKGNRDEDETVRRDVKTREGIENCNTCRENDIICLRESNCVSTIKKLTTQQLAEVNLNEKSTANGEDSEVMILPKDSQDSCRAKQNNMHWRRRIAETLKPC
ncbi:zinc finger protein 888-like isoform X1 [Cataglyphis hispanica]|uniref:zinc finger protein 888-like isoform X1 n=1 Tax=Cataglyphis hispanica TaxID=1086592 RepID=UPI002180117B|nr:zinc finger protein 888-like isoform X1 [Cataglyphis hispanica]XP_050461375.1 zinc finger protein 888-like isoform X1 [Cataglyphis hispanica]